QVFEYNASGTAESNNSSLVTRVSVLAAADFQVDSLVTEPATGLRSGMGLLIRWNDTNTGNLAALGSFTDRVTVTNVTTGRVLATDTVPYDASARGDLVAGTSAAQRWTFTLPDGYPGVGQIQFTVVTDASNAIPEANPVGTAESNNSAELTRESNLAPYP